MDAIIKAFPLLPVNQDAITFVRHQLTRGGQIYYKRIGIKSLEKKFFLFNNNVRNCNLSKLKLAS